tara:strand:- start:3421 stop:7824 length:4404 start_codon:yes stop_codon:yes gene_type:complete
MSYSFNDIDYIDKIEFNIFTNNDIKDYSSINSEEGINIPETYDLGEPKRGGLVDTRLGVTDGNLQCAFCGLNANNCQGHHGHTKLGMPIFHYGFLSYIKSILMCICFKTSKLLIDIHDENLKYLFKLEGKKRLDEIKLLSSKVLVSNVGIPVPKIKLEIKNSIINFIAEYKLTSSQDSSEKKNLKEYLNSSDIYDILLNISNEDWDFMGFNSKRSRPEDLIIKYLPIPTITIRPSLKTEYLALSTFEDSMIHILVEIIKNNNKLIKNKDKEQSGITDIYTTDTANLLQYHCATLFDNNSLSLPTNEQKVGGKPAKSVSERLKGKTGRIRSNLMGKRVDFSARTVITGDPNININELGVPIKIATNLTFPEIVTHENKQRLNQLVKNGRDIYPGANFVRRKSQFNSRVNIIDLRYRNNIELEIGDTIDRHIVNGDYVLLNRQPSLHKFSMMAHNIKVIDDDDLNTFRLNVCATPPYNADFDGDEMNLHVPQNIQTQLELEYIGNLKNNIISSRYSAPIIEFVQDTVLGLYKLTDDSVKINWRDAMNLLTYCKDIKDTSIEKNKIYSGKEICSRLIYDNINVSKAGVEINNGVIKKGKLTSKINQMLLGNIWYKYGSDKSIDFLFNGQRIIANWLLMEGFSVGISDIILNKSDKIDIIKETEKKKMEIFHLITEIENNSDMIDSETFENSITENLKSNKGVIEKMVMSKLDDSNGYFLMAKKYGAGSKGSGINLMQMSGALGQDILEYKRIPKKVNGRSLPHFFQNDDGAVARGYITRSYFDGLTPSDFFFHNMAAREGLIDTAIKTQDTGYISRKLMKGCEDAMLKYDNTVRIVNNQIIQFVYGDNGVDQTRQTTQHLSLINKDDKKILSQYFFNSSEIKILSSKFKLDNFNNINNKYYDELILNINELRKIQQKFIMNYIIVIDSYASPINFKRLVIDIINFSSSKDKKELINPMYIYDKINYILSKCNIINYTKPNSIKSKDNDQYRFLLKLFLFEYLSPKIIIDKYKLTKYKFDILVQQIIDEFIISQTEPGEMVGSLGAQHIGEPSTQMTLNTFHSTGAGVVGMQGVPRLRELISITKNIKTPSMEIYLNDNENYDNVKKIKSYINLNKFSDIIFSFLIIYDIDKNGIVKKDNISNMFNVYDTQNNDISTMPFIIKIILDKNKMINYSISLFEVKTQFVKYWKENFTNVKNIKRQDKEIINNIISCGIMSNNENEKNPIIHIRFDMKNYNLNKIINFKDLIFNKIIIKGLNDVKNVNLVEKQFIKFDNNNKINTIKEYALITDGINIKDIRYIKGIDLERFITNDINITYKYYGIEAARSLLIKELTSVFSSSGNDVNYHHISILIDIITHKGILISIDRHGLPKLDSEPLANVSFENEMKNFISAAMYNQVDNVESVASRIICGRVIKGGTGSFDLVMDNELIEDSEYIQTTLQDEQLTIIFTKNEIFEDILNKKQINCFLPL